MAELPDFAIEIAADRTVEQFPSLNREALPEQIRYILGLAESLSTLAGGDPIGMIRRGPNGEIAERVIEASIPCWRVTYNGNVSYDHEPTLPWDVLYTPPIETDPPTDPPTTEETP